VRGQGEFGAGVGDDAPGNGIARFGMSQHQRRKGGHVAGARAARLIQPGHQVEWLTQAQGLQDGASQCGGRGAPIGGTGQRLQCLLAKPVAAATIINQVAPRADQGRLARCVDPVSQRAGAGQHQDTAPLAERADQIS